jgi:hypothetical protein
MENKELKTTKADRSFFVPIERLCAYEEFSSFKHGSNWEIIDFIQFFYHKDSPFARDYDNIQERAFACLGASGLREQDPWSLHLLTCGIETANAKAMGSEDGPLFDAIDAMIACYLARVMNNSEWEALVTLQILSWEYAKKLRTPATMVMEPDKELKAMEMKTKITEPYLELPSKIKSLSDRIFGNSDKIASAAKEKIGGRPEDFARKYAK